MLLWLLRLVLLFILLRLLWRFVVGIVEGASPPERRSPPDTGVPLVRDPVCGMYVVPARALTAGEGSTQQFFCSEECRATYRRQHR